MKTYIEVMIDAGFMANTIEAAIAVTMDIMESDSLDYYEFTENVSMVADLDGYNLRDNDGNVLAHVADYSWVRKQSDVAKFNAGRYEITQLGVYLGSLKAESPEKAIEKASEEFYDYIDALGIDGNPPLVATALFKEIK